MIHPTRIRLARRTRPLPLALLVVAVLAGAATGVAAQSAVPQAPFEFRAAEVDRPVDVDGTLSEDVWRTAQRIPLPYEGFPGSNAPAPVETECRVAYDADVLYLGCFAADPNPEQIRAFITDRDDQQVQDAIVLGLSPHDDGRRAFLFQVNPLGVQGDAMYDEAREQPDPSYDAIWESAGRIVEGGYVVEMGIPFRSLRFPDRAGSQSWSFYVERYWPRQARVRTQSFYEDESEACRLCQVNRLSGLTGISSGGAVQLTPTVSANRQDARPLGDARWSTGSFDPEAGLDMVWSVTSDVTLNATLNPDFSQVEADAAQLDVNQRFALFFPERRPFFQEGADLFSTPMNLAFTRTIVDPDFGGKVTGKVGGNAFGALVARDQVTSLLLPGPYASGSAFLEQPTWTGIGTYRRDVTHTSTVGGLLTVREGNGYSNRVGSVDAFFRPTGAMQVRLQAARSTTDYPDTPAFDGEPADPFAGNLFYADVQFDNRRWFGTVGSRFQQDGFRADAGFLPQSDFWQRWGWVRHRWFGTSESLVTQLTVAGGAWNDVTAEAQSPISRGMWTTVNVVLPGQSDLFINPNIRSSRFAGQDFDLWAVRYGGSTSPVRWLSAGYNGVFGTNIDFANTRRARVVEAAPNVTVRPGKRFEARLSYSFQRLDTEDGQRIFDAGVAQGRLVYNFSHRAFIRAIVQHRLTNRNPDTHTDPVTPVRESALSQLLFSYKVNPQTVLFLGYSDDRLGVDPLNDPRVSLTPTGRTFFFKVGYAIQP